MKKLRYLLILFGVNIICNCYTQTHSFDTNVNNPDTIILKNFWINPKYFINEKRIYVRQFNSIMCNDQIVLNVLRKGRTLRIIGHSTAFISGGVSVAGLSKYQNSGDIGLLITGISIFGGSLVIDYFAKSKFRDVVRIYNRNLISEISQVENNVKLMVSPIIGGLSISITF